MNEWINDKGGCRTAPDTPGPLTMNEDQSKSISSSRYTQTNKCRKWEFWSLCYCLLLSFCKLSNVLVGGGKKLTLENCGAGCIG